MVHDGPSALDAALDFRPHVVLLDIGLPGLDGAEVAKRLRQQPVFQNVTLIAMTGYGHEADRERSLEAGFDHHLVKPVGFGTIDKILATVSEEAIVPFAQQAHVVRLHAEPSGVVDDD